MGFNNRAYWHFATSQKGISKNAISNWNERSDHSSWYARRIREKLISEVKQSSQSGLLYIKTLVAAAPLFGLLGTVTGMVEVFDVMAITGSSNARAMAAGISKSDPTYYVRNGCVFIWFIFYCTIRIKIKKRDFLC